MRRNRELRDEQIAEEERLAAIERRERDREAGLAAREEYEARVVREKARADENDEARKAVRGAPSTPRSTGYSILIFLCKMSCGPSG